VEWYIRSISNGYLVELQTITAGLADRQENITPTLVYKLIREDTG
jgi:hypothetical protein